MSERGTVIDYRYPEKSNTRLDTPVVATILLGLTSLILGIFTLNLRWEFMELSRDSVSFLLYILSGLILIMATRTLRNRIITESVYFILAAFSAIMYTLSSVQNDSEMLYSMILFALGFVACTYIFKSRGEMFLSVMSATFATIIVVGAILPEDTGIIANLLLIFNGIALIVAAGLTLSGFVKRDVMIPSQSREMEDEEFPEIMVSTVGVLLFGIMSFSVGIKMMGETGLLTSFIVFKLFMAMIVLAIGLYATYHGIAGEGLTMALVGLSSLVYAVSMLMFEHVPHYFDIILGALLMPIAISLVLDREYLLGATSFLLASVMMLEAFWEGSEMLEYMIMAAKVIATVFALITWYRYDVGSKPRFIQFIERKLKVVIQ